MSKALCIIGLVVAILLFLLFALDLMLSFPFRRVSLPMDIGIGISSVVLGYISWITLKEQKG